METIRERAEGAKAALDKWCEDNPQSIGKPLAHEKYVEYQALESEAQWTATERGLQLMAEKWPDHFADLLKENDDAITADVFLQCYLFGDVVYG